MTTTLDQLVTLPAGFKPSVQLPNDFYNPTINTDLLATFLPTEQSVRLLGEVARSLQPSSTERARMLHGTFGTGKSDLLLMLANYYSRTIDDPIMQPLYDRIKEVNEGMWETIRNHRSTRPPFLVVLLQATSERPFPGFVLHGLQRALEQVGMQALMGLTRYAAAIQRIRDWQQHYPQVLDRFERTLRTREAKEVDGLIAELRDANADIAFQTFQRVFREVTGTEFSIFEYDQPEVTYKQVARALVQQGSHSGILLIIDEFTELLRRFVRVSDAQPEALVLQNIAEAASSSDKNQLHFLVAGLEPFASTAARIEAASVAEIIERIGGRFKPYALQVQGSEELLRGALQRTSGTEQIVRLYNRQRDELLAIAEKLWRPMSRSREWIRQVIVDGAFPLHPTTVYLMPEINQKVAQNQRTMFLFLNDQQGLPAELARTPLTSSYPAWHNLITPDVLFDYFRTSIEARYEDIVDAYRLADMHLQAATVDTALARRVLKIIAICEVAPSLVIPTGHAIQQALNLPDEALPELDQALNMLDSMNAIYVPSEAGGAYGLLLGDRVNPGKIRRLLVAKGAEVEKNASVETLNTSAIWQAPPIPAEEYNRSRGSMRSLKATFVAPMMLKDDTRIKRMLNDAASQLDGAILYVITDSETERLEALSLARQLTAPITHQRMVIAVPEKPTPILRRLRDYLALARARLDSTLSERERAYLSEQGRIGQELGQALNQEHAQLKRPEAWIWCYAGEQVPLGRGSPSTIASRVMERTFPNTPQHSIQQHLKSEPLIRSDKLPAALQRAIEELLKRTVRVPRGAKGPEWAVIRNGAARMGLLRPGQNETAYEVFIVAQPDAKDQAAWHVWSQFEQLEKIPDWNKLLDSLRKAPFGLYDSLILIFAASFFTLRADELTIMRGNSRLLLTTNTIAELVAAPQGVSIKLQPLSEHERRWLHAIVERGLGKKVDTSGGPLRERVATQVRQWFNGLKLPPFVEHLAADDLRRFLPHERPEHVAALHVLLQHGKSPDLVPRLLEDLPVVLGLPIERNTWNDGQLTEAIDALVPIFQALTQLPATLEAYATSEVAKIFGALYTTAKENWQAIYQWRGMRNAVSTIDLPSEARRLFLLLNDYEGTIKNALLNDFASTIVPAIGAYDNWPSLDKLTQLGERLSKAIQVIDEHWKRNAPQEQVWLNTVAHAAAGRNVTDHKPEKIGEILAKWVTASDWPASAGQLTIPELQLLYPERDIQQLTRMSQLLRRREFSATQWAEDLSQQLAADFAVNNWSRNAVEQGASHFAQAIIDTSELNERMRRHVLHLLSSAFRASADDARPLEVLVHDWLATHPIPAENDLSEDAQILLRHLDASGAVDTLLTERLPRAYPIVGGSYRQWQSYQHLATYIALVQNAVHEINAYTPLTSAQTQWLETLARGVGHPLARPARELHRLAEQAYHALNAWRAGLNLPLFAQDLSIDELCQLMLTDNCASLEAVRLLLDPAPGSNATAHLLVALPNALGSAIPYTEWDANVVDVLAAHLATAIDLAQNLNKALISQLTHEVAAVFGSNGSVTNTADAAQQMRAWRRSFVLLGTTRLSELARSLSDLLQTAEDPRDLILRRLPQRITENRTPYESWRTWNERHTLLHNLHMAAREIEQAGQIGEVSPQAHTLWKEVRTQLAVLSDDDRRWFVKQFEDTFRQ